MPQLLDQPIASTALDLHGEQISKEELFHLFKQLPSEFPINDSHDLSRASGGIAQNPRFVEIEPGVWAIIVDISIDNDLFISRGGFSMSWVTNTHTTHPNRLPDIQVLFNPRLFRSSIAADLCTLSDDETNIVVGELKQKGIDPDAILIIQFLTTAALSGFIGKPASDLYDKILQRLQKLDTDVLNPKKSAPPIQFHVPKHLNPYRAQIIVEVLPEQLEHLQVGALSFEDAVEVSKVVPYTAEARRIVVKAVGEPPRWTLVSYEKATGVTISI